MPHLAPPTLTAAEQKEILRVTAANVRDHTIFSVALRTRMRPEKPVRATPVK